MGKTNMILGEDSDTDVETWNSCPRGIKDMDWILRYF